MKFITRYIKEHRVKSTLIAIAVLVLVGMTLQTVAQNSSLRVDEERIPKVSLIKVGEYQVENAQIDAIGEVESLSQVELKSQLSERIQEIRVSIGERVSRGQILLVLDAASLDSQIGQAEANVEAEMATLQQMKKNLRPEDGGSITSDAQINLDNAILKAEVDLKNVYASALTASQKAVQVGIDALLILTDIQYAHFNGNTQDAIRIVDAKTVAVRILLGEEYEDVGRLSTEYLSRMSGGVFEVVQDAITAPTEEKIDKAIVDTAQALQKVKNALDVVPITSSVTPAEQINLSTQKSSITNEIVALSKNEQAITSQKTINKNSIEAARQAGITKEQVNSQQARVRSAQAGVSSLRSQQSKVAITAPISGLIATVPVRVGEFVNIGEVVTSIVNPSSLQIRTYLNSRDIQFVTQGAKVLIEEGGEGVVTKVAPSIDPQTKKVEALVAVLDQGEESFVIGQFANVKILIDEELRKNNLFFLPLQAIKVTPSAAFVFVVNEEMKIEQHAVELGRIIGSSIEVSSGLELNMEIVFSVRGLAPDQLIEIK